MVGVVGRRRVVVVTDTPRLVGGGVAAAIKDSLGRSSAISLDVDIRSITRCSVV